MQPIQILYIHGYGSGENSITGCEIQRKLGEKAKVFMPGFSNEVENFENTLANIQKAQDFVNDNKIDLVIASSMGGFTALQVTDVRKILINPCMVPSDIFRLEILPDISEAEIEKYVEMENRSISLEEKKMTYSLFATNDELFSYKDRFDQLYDASKSFSMPGKHVISPKNIRENLIPLINQLFPL